MKKNKQKNEKKKYDSNITKEDLDILGKKGLSMNRDDDQLLQERKRKVDFAGKDLDVPGRQTLDKSKSTKLSDEENSLYGLGDEDNENLEETEPKNRK